MAYHTLLFISSPLLLFLLLPLPFIRRPFNLFTTSNRFFNKSRFSQKMSFISQSNRFFGNRRNFLFFILIISGYCFFAWNYLSLTSSSLMDSSSMEDEGSMTKTLNSFWDWNSLQRERDSEDSLQEDIYKFAPVLAHQDPYVQHPIHELIRRAKQDWNNKLRKESKNFHQAVKEYKRRYRREPPPGFDLWYNFSKERNVKLIDEYDPIMRNILPFLSLSSEEIRRRIEFLWKESNWNASVAMIRIQDGKVLETPFGANWRKAVSGGFIRMIQPFSHHLPDMDIPVYLHDGPITKIPWDHRQRYIKAAEDGELIDESELNFQNRFPWPEKARLCPPNSIYHKSLLGYDDILTPPSFKGPSFIQNHFKAMNHCNHEFIFTRNSGALSTDSSIHKLFPSFTMSSFHFSGDFIWPPPIQYSLNPENELPFEKKPYHKILWRGSLDGISVQSPNPWRTSHRFRLTELFNSNDTTKRVIRSTKKDFLGREYQIDISTNLKELNERYSGIRPTGVPVQCDPMTCEFLKEKVEFFEKISLEEMSKYRYVFDTDGNSYSARFRTHLQGNQVPFKSTVFAEWYHTRIQPWVHYVPIRLDLKDVYNVLAFFDGHGKDRIGNHDELAKSIAEEGRDWAENFWRIEDMQAYLFRLLLEYARLLRPERSPQLSLKEAGLA